MLGNETLDDMVAEMDEEDDTEHFVILKMFTWNRANERLIKWKNVRLDWERHVERERHTGSFRSKYHMSEESFNRLVDLLRPAITVHYQKSMNSTSGNAPIFPELVAACGLRFLGGELWKSLEDIFGIDISSVKRVVRMFFRAIEGQSTLQIALPDTVCEMETLSQEFAQISSSNGLFTGVIGAIDGWLCCTTSPIDRDITNKRAYYSGHYSRFGLNVQAVCDARLRFIYFAVAAPGGTNDARAIRRCHLFNEWIEKIKGKGYFIVGDNAYVLSDETLIPFSGRALTDHQRTYNFFLSQLRICIELAFGRLTTKWRIFRRNLEFGMEFNSRICIVAAVLHNYVLNEDTANGIDDTEISAMMGAPNDLGYLPSNPTNSEDPLAADPIHDAATETPGQSTRRQTFLHFINVNDMSRPEHNIQRYG